MINFVEKYHKIAEFSIECR